ncbi:MAG: MFS transporter [Chloroflexi bacterium]|nr:MFS transporter [Chloroflexota bacterium]
MTERRAGIGGRVRFWGRGLTPAIALLGAMTFITQVGVSIMLPLLPLYATSLGATPTVLGLLTSSFAVLIAVGQLAGGYLVERVAPRRLVSVGIVTYAVANVLISTAGVALHLIAFRSIAGLGAGINQVSERLYIAHAIDRTRLAFANGVLSAAGSAGAVLGPAIGGLLVGVSDLRLPFLAVAVTSAVAAVGSLFLPKPPPERPATATPTEPAPIPGPATAPKTRLAGRFSWSTATRILVILFLVQTSFQAGFGAFITTYAVFAQERLDWSITEVGLVFSAFGLGSILLGPVLANLADRRGRRDVAILGAALVFAFPIVFVVEAPRPILYFVSVVGGAGVTALEASFFALLADATDGGRRGRAYGWVTSLSSLGIVVGAIAASQLWDRTGDVGLGLLMTAVALVFVVAFLLVYPRDRPAPTATA